MWDRYPGLTAIRDTTAVYKTKAKNEGKIVREKSAKRRFNYTLYNETGAAIAFGKAKALANLIGTTYQNIQRVAITSSKIMDRYTVTREEINEAV